MREYRTETVVREDGTVAVNNLPFKAGECVEVIVHERRTDGQAKEDAATRYPLRGKGPYRFDDPLSPVGLDDWDDL